MLRIKDQIKPDLTTITGRVVYVWQHSDYNATEFAGVLDISLAHLNKIIDGTVNSIGSDILGRLVRSFPLYNPAWIITGEEPIKRDEVRKTPLPEPKETKVYTEKDLLIVKLETKLEQIHEELDWARNTIKSNISPIIQATPQGETTRRHERSTIPSGVG